MAFASWDETEAARLRQKAKDMDSMLEDYRRKPKEAQRRVFHGSPKVEFIQQDKILAALG